MDESKLLHVDLEHTGPPPAVVVRLDGELDYGTTPRLVAALGTVPTTGVDLILDLTRLRFCDSTALEPLYEGIHDHYEPVIAANNNRLCEKCKTAVAFPINADAVAPQDRDRIKQFLHGGPLYCAKCYQSAPPCHDCGWHVMMEKIAEHFKKSHSH